MMMSSKDVLKVKIGEMLDSDFFIDVVREEFFEGDSLRYKWDKENNSIAYQFSVELDDAGITEQLCKRHGGEGEGDQYWAVWSFTCGADKVYVKFAGSYASYDGSTYDSWFFVEPEEYTAVRYNKVK